MHSLTQVVKVISVGLFLYPIVGLKLQSLLVEKETDISYYCNCSQLAFITGASAIFLALAWMLRKDISQFEKTMKFIIGPFLCSIVLTFLFSGKATLIPPQYFTIFVMPGSIVILGLLEFIKERKLKTY